MKIKVITVENAQDIIEQYWNEQGDTISFRAKEILQERIDMDSTKVEVSEEQAKKLRV